MILETTTVQSYLLGHLTQLDPFYTDTLKKTKNFFEVIDYNKTQLDFSDNYIPTAIFLTKKVIEEKVYNCEVENGKLDELLKICEKINLNSILEHTPTLS